MLGQDDVHINLVFSGTAGKDWADARARLGLTIPVCNAPLFRLYVGDIHAARDNGCLASYDITHVVNCGVADLEPHEHAPHPAISYMSIRTSDANFALKPAPYGTVAESENPTLQWPAAITHLYLARAAGTAALVHCIAGANRSVTTAAVFLTVAGLVPSFVDALKMIKAARPCANPMRSYIKWGAAACASWEALAGVHFDTREDAIVKDRTNEGVRCGLVPYDSSLTSAPDRASVTAEVLDGSALPRTCGTSHIGMEVSDIGAASIAQLAPDPSIV